MAAEQRASCCGHSEGPANAHRSAGECAAGEREAQNGTKAAAHRRPGTPAPRRTWMHVAAIRAVLLLSAAVSTHMSPDGDADADRARSVYGHYINARGPRAATGALLRYADIDGSQSRLAASADDGLHAGGAFGLRSRHEARTSTSGLTPEDLGGSAGSFELDSIKTHGAATAHLVGDRVRSEDVDITLEGVVGLSASAPHGQAVVGSIAGWPIARAGGPRNRHTLGNQPKVALLDMFEKKQTQFCTGYAGCIDVIHPVTAAIFNNPGCSKLHGTTIVQTVDGVATFTDLMIENPQSLYRLRFTAGLQLSPVTVITPPFKVLKGQIYIPDDPLWNFIATADDQCQCGTVTLPSLTQTRMTIRAGQLIQSSLGENWQPCTGYEFPTVWVRKYNARDTQAGPECDGWEDVTDWDFDIQVSLVDPGCTIIAGDVDEVVCRTGMHGALTCATARIACRPTQILRHHSFCAQFSNLTSANAGSMISCLRALFPCVFVSETTLNSMQAYAEFYTCLATECVLLYAVR